jgi:hypothetical protein
VKLRASRPDCIRARAKAFLIKPIENICMFQKIGRLLNLIWSPKHPQPTPVPVNDPVERFVVPDPTQMEPLRELAKAGNMRDICETAAHLAAPDTSYGPLPDRITELALGYQSKALLRLVEKCAAQQGMKSMEQVTTHE